MRAEVPHETLQKLRVICLAMPQAVEQAAWTGVRWRIRAATFAHVLRIEDGWPPAYAKAAGSEGPLVVLTFRSGIAELDRAHYADPPFFRPPWFSDIVGLSLDAATDWEEVESLVSASYRRLAPRKLAALLAPPKP